MNLEELGRPLLLVFFNLGCPACWEVLPALEPLTSQLAVAVLISPGGSEEEQVRLAGYAAGGGVHVLEVGPGVVEAYRVLRTPTFFLVDGEGVIVWAEEGFSSEAELVAEIRGVLAGFSGQEESSENPEGGG